MTSRATKVSRRSILGSAAALGAGLGHAHAQEQPAGGTLRWLVPFAPGGGSDMAARIVAVELSKILNQSVVVDNRPGGNTNIAVQALMSARPDGNTVMSASNDTLTINPHLYNVPYQAERDFEYVALLIKFPHLLVARKDFPAENARDAISYIRSQGPSLAYASFGVGSVAHMGMEMLLKRIGTTATHVPYRGSAPAISDLLGGRVDIMMDAIPSSVPHVLGGKLKALAWAGKERNPVLPDLVTLQEAGIAGFDYYSWQGIIMPRGTPQARIRILEDAFRNAVELPDVRRTLGERGIDVSYLDGQAFRDLSTTGSRTMKEVITENNIHVD